MAQDGPPTLSTLPTEIRLNIFRQLYLHVQVRASRDWLSNELKQVVTGFAVAPLLLCQAFHTEITSYILPECARSWRLKYVGCSPPPTPDRILSEHVPVSEESTHPPTHIRFLEQYGKYLTRIDHSAGIWGEPAFHNHFELGWFPNARKISTLSLTVVHRNDPNGGSAKQEQPFDEKDFWEAADNPVGDAAWVCGLTGLRERFEKTIERSEASSDLTLLTSVLWDPAPGVNEVSQCS